MVSRPMSLPFVPTPCLARRIGIGRRLITGLLMLTAWNMSEPQKWREYMKMRVEDRALLVLTLVLTVVADLTVAIGVGVALGLALRLRRREVPPADWKMPKR